VKKLYLHAKYPSEDELLKLRTFLKEKSNNIHTLKIIIDADLSYPQEKAKVTILYSIIQQLLRNRLQNLDITIKLASNSAEDPLRFQGLSQALTSELSYLESLNFKLIGDLNASYSYSTFNFCKTIPKLRHTLRHLSLDLSEVELFNKAQITLKAIGKLYILEHLHLKLGLVKLINDPLPLEDFNEIKLDHLKYFQFDLENDSYDYRLTDLVQAITHYLFTSSLNLVAYILTMKRAYVHGDLFAYIGEGLISSHTLKILKVSFDDIVMCEFESVSIFTQAIENQSSKLESILEEYILRNKFP